MNFYLDMQSKILPAEGIKHLQVIYSHFATRSLTWIPMGEMNGNHW